MVKRQTQRTSKPISEPTKKTCKNPGEIDPNNIVSQPRRRKNIDYKVIETKGKVVNVERETNNILEKRLEKKQTAVKVAKMEKKGIGETIFKPSKKSADGTSYHGDTITCTAGDLIKLFPNAQVHICHDSNYEFYLENSNGDIITIYDHGMDGVKLPKNEKWVFNVGGFSRDVTKQAASEVEKLLKKLTKK